MRASSGRFVEEPVAAARANTGSCVQQLVVERRRREQRHEPDHRADLAARVEPPCACMLIVVEAVVVATTGRCRRACSSPARSRRSARRTSARGPRTAAPPSRARAPSRASSCSRTPSTRSRRPASSSPPPGSGWLRSNTPTLSSPRKPPVNRLSPVGILAVDPPREVDEALVERALEEHAVVAVAGLGGELVDAPHRPRVHRRVDVAERELVRGQLPVRVHVPLAAQQQELLLRELGIEARHRDAVEREVPRREPRVLPAVGHRDHVARPQLRPSLRLRPCLRASRRRRLRRIAVEPVLDDVVIELARPHEAGVGLADDVALLVGHRRRCAPRGGTRRPRSMRSAKIVVEVARTAPARDLRSTVSRSAHDARLAAAGRRARTTRRTSCRAARG